MCGPLAPRLAQRCTRFDRSGLRSSLRTLGWWMYVALGWLPLALFFWCLLLVAARADRRDAPHNTRRFARTRRLLERRTLAGGGSARDEPDEHLLHHRRHRR
jgi:hypothetical protein